MLYYSKLECNGHNDRLNINTLAAGVLSSTSLFPFSDEHRTKKRLS